MKQLKEKKAQGLGTKTKGTEKEKKKTKTRKTKKKELVNPILRMGAETLLFLRKYLNVLIGVPLTLGGIYAIYTYKDTPYEAGIFQQVVTCLLLSSGVLIVFSKSLNELVKGDYVEED